MRGFGLAVVIGLACWWGLLVLADAAFGGTLDGRMEALDDEIGLFMASRGYDAPEPQVFLGSPELFAEIDSRLEVGSRALAVASPQGTLLRPELATWIGSPVNFGRLVNVLAHEKAHRLWAVQPAAAAWSEQDRQIEEAAVEAVARDITAAFMRVRYPWVPYTDWDEFYPRATAMVRACSARAVRRSWRHPRAHLWRRGFWRAGPVVRRDRLQACGVRL